MFLFALAAALAVLSSAPAAGQDPATNASPPQPRGSILGGKSPPQPLQPQGLDYFVGAWTFKWTGRESPVSSGPRTGTVTYARAGDRFLTASIEGRSEAAGTFRETGMLGWHDAQKVVAWHERLADGIDVLSIGDWTSPLSIRFESAPVRVKGQALTLKRTVTIVSAHSFTVSEELSIDGGPFVRLGGGVFSKSAARE